MTDLIPDYVRFFVPGDAKTSGSKKSFTNPKTGKQIMAPDSPYQKTWQQAVKWQAMQAWARRIPWTGALVMDMVFIRPYKTGHYGTGRNAGKLKDWVKDEQPTTKPDTLKLGRAVEDAISKIIYLDDSQIVEHHIRKMYGPKPGVDVVIRKYKRERTHHEQANPRRTKNVD